MLCRSFREKANWGTYGFLDGGHDLAEHGFNAERVLTGGPMMGLFRHHDCGDETRSR